MEDGTTLMKDGTRAELTIEIDDEEENEVLNVQNYLKSFSSSRDADGEPVKDKTTDHAFAEDKETRGPDNDSGSDDASSDTGEGTSGSSKANEKNAKKNKKTKKDLNEHEDQSNRAKRRKIEVGSSADDSKIEILKEVKSYVPSNTPYQLYYINEKGSTLGSIVHMRQKILETHKIYTSNLKLLYRLMYGRKPSVLMTFRELKREILKFSGYPFKKSSKHFEILKQELINAGLPSVRFFCQLFFLPGKDLNRMVAFLLDFLLKPYFSVYAEIDPTLLKMQPALRIRKLPISEEDIPKRLGRKRKVLNAENSAEYFKNESSNDSAEDCFENESSDDSVQIIATVKKSGNKIKTENRGQKKKYTQGKKISKSVFASQNSRIAAVRAKQKFSSLNQKAVSKPMTSKVSSMALYKSKLLISKSIADKKNRIKAKKRLDVKDAISTNKNSHKKKIIHTIIPEVKPEDDKKVEGEKSKFGRTRKLSLKYNMYKDDLQEKVSNKLKINEHVQKPKIKESAPNRKIQQQSPKARRGRPPNSTKLPQFYDTYGVGVKKEPIQAKNTRPEVDVKTVSVQTSTVKSPTVLKKSGEVKQDNTDNVESNTTFESQDEDILFQGSQSLGSSEITLSADETSDAVVSADENVEDSAEARKRVSYQRIGKPLKTFSQVKDNINDANYNVLQRLHILLFGSQDKVENLKGNILAFGGFPFLEGSNEWDQKEFLLSLASQTNIKEYLNLLCVEFLPEEDQQSLISRLMRFLGAPCEETQEKIPLEPKSRIISPEAKKRTIAYPSLTVKSVKKKVPKKPPAKKKAAKNTRHRKVLMDEAQVRKLELELAREQRAVEREKRLNQLKAEAMFSSQVAHVTSKEINEKFRYSSSAQAKQMKETTDSEQLNALLQTVYKRRALKAAGAVISTPNKGQHTRLGELENVKFLITTSNFNDLDVLHHLIYMTECTRSRLRKNILDFAGFGFNEDSPKYKDRLSFLCKLGYDISKRIGFLLGLCPFKTNISQFDLNELIMYFLMSPCKTKQVPIREMPVAQPGKEMPADLCLLLQQHISTESPDGSPRPSTDGRKARKSVSTTKSKQAGQGALISSPMRRLIPEALNSAVTPIRGETSGPQLGALHLSSLTKIPDSVTQIAQSLPPVDTDSEHQVFLVQQQTPDGKQRTFKLVKLNTSYAKKPPKEEPIPVPALAINSPITGVPLPPGIIVVNPTQNTRETLEQLGQNVMLTPNSEQQIMYSSALLGKSNKTSETPTSSSDSSKSTRKSSYPTREEIFNCVQDAINEADFEDITLRNVIEKVESKYPEFDLAIRHTFMKECVKKILLGVLE